MYFTTRQEWVDDGVSLPETLKLYYEWLQNQGFITTEEGAFKENKSFIFVTCGDWDLNMMHPGQSKREKTHLPPFLRRWVNIKKIFQSFYNRTNALGMAGMLKVANIELTVKHHSGIGLYNSLSTLLTLYD